MDKDTKFRLERAANYYLEDCGSCGACHPVDFHGDCRDDINRIGAPEDLVTMWQTAPELLKACKEIAEAKGAYSMDRLEHCSNTVEAMVEIAKQVIAKAEQA